MSRSSLLYLVSALLVLGVLAALSACTPKADPRPSAPFLVRVTGRSMLPYIKTDTQLFVLQFPYEKLEAGMVVVRRDSWGDVLHALKSYNPKTDSWVMQGTYNEAPDSWPLTRVNYVGYSGIKVPLIFPLPRPH